MKKLKEELKYGKKGITLISLVVTIIVLLILAGITINMLFGENGLLNRATDATEEYSKAEAKEKVELLLSEYVIDKATGENDNFANFLRKNLQVGVSENDDNTYSFMLGEWQVVTDENKVISIEKFKLDVDKTYPNVASMRADTELTDGQLVQTESYWDKQYGGSAYYDIVSSTSLTVDDGKCIQLDNGLYAELHPINGTVTVNQFGAYGDGEHDDAETIQLALNTGYGNITFESERYKFGKTIKLSTDNVYVIGNNATLFWDESVVTPWEQIGITGTSEKHVQNINIFYLNFENGDISVIEDPGESIQLRGSYCDNIEISNCKFNIYEIDGNKSRQITNLWFHTEWKNIIVQDCEFKNLTNSNVGGSIWLSDLTSNSSYISQNAIIKNNYIEKSCHDETIAVWRGVIENVEIENNEFYLHEEKVENPSFMNFTFGNGTGKVYNINFINNKVKSEYAGISFYINGNSSNGIYIQNNNLEYNKENLNFHSPFIMNNSNTKNVVVKANNIKINETSNQSFAFGNMDIENNTITIVSNYLVALTDMYTGNDTIEKSGTVKYINNNISIKSNLEYKLIGSSYVVKGNNFNITGKVPGALISFSGMTIQDNINICNNKFTLLDDNLWEQNSKKFISFIETNINGFDVNISDNEFEIINQTNIQTLINLHNVTSNVSNTIIMNNNYYNIFKNIVFSGNSLNNIIKVNENEITTNTTLK